MAYSLLLVEDDDQIRNGLSTYFPWGDLGYQVVACCANGMEALEFVRNHDVDVILTDIRMPMMDGLEMLEKMRLENVNAYIVILSAYGNFEYAQRAIELGVSNYIIKTTKFDNLVQVFRNIRNNLDKGTEIQNDLPLKVVPKMKADKVQDIERYIEDHIADATLQSVADHMKYNPVYFSRFFKENTGVSFIDYLLKKKMEYATKLLRSTKLPISVISEKVGYSNEKNFSRAFKRYVGCNASEYRRNI